MDTKQNGTRLLVKLLDVVVSFVRSLDEDRVLLQFLCCRHLADKKGNS
jgi:hypothetical protein